MASAKQNNGGYATQDLNAESSPAQVAKTVDTTHPQSSINNGGQHPQSMQQQHNTAAENMKAGNRQYTFLSTNDHRLKVEGWRKSVSGDASEQTVGQTYVNVGEFYFEMDSASAPGSEESSEESEGMEYTMNTEKNEDDQGGSRISSDSDPDELV